MDAIELLKEDHRTVKQLFQKWESMPEGQPDARRKVAEEILAELMVHERIEEEIFYPAYKRATDEEGKKLTAEAKEEHHVVDLIIDELQGVSIGAEDFEAKLKVLKENVEHHIEEEEKEMFPDAKRILGDKLAALGEEMMEYKKSLRTQVEKPGREAGPKRAR